MRGSPRKWKLLLVVVLTGCSSVDVSTVPAINHPANPQAEQTVYEPTPNVLATDSVVEESPAAPATGGEHEGHGGHHE